MPKALTSAKWVTPIGRPSFSMLPISRQFGPSQCVNG